MKVGTPRQRTSENSPLARHAPLRQVRDPRMLRDTEGQTLHATQRPAPWARIVSGAKAAGAQQPLAAALTVGARYAKSRHVLAI
jgi:hypothetical protein